MRSSKLSQQPVDHILDRARFTVACERDGLNALTEALDGSLGRDFTLAVHKILACQGRIHTTGLGKSGHVARKVAATLTSTGTPATFLHAAEASHGDLGIINSNDIIIAFSWSGETSELQSVIKYSRRFSVYLIAITSRNDSALGTAADLCLTLPAAAEACPNGLAPTTSTTMQMVAGDAVAMALLAERGFRMEDFHRYHPGGSLGSALLSVREIMHKGDSIPIVHSATVMADAIIAMTRKAFGILAVVDDSHRLVGVVTDGDLRRAMSVDLLSRRVSEVMTRRPKTLPPTTLASAALALMSSKKITAVLIVSDQEVLGIIHMHDLLRAGVA